MTENMKKFLTLSKENKEISEKLKKGLSKEDLIALAKEQGIELAEEDFMTNGKNLLSLDGGTALSDEELDNVAGGEHGFEDDRFYWVTFQCKNCGCEHGVKVAGVIWDKYMTVYLNDWRCFGCGERGSNRLISVELM